MTTSRPEAGELAVLEAAIHDQTCREMGFGNGYFDTDHVGSSTCQERAVAVLAALRDHAPSYIEVRTSECHAGSDGDCSWSGCPQPRDGEPVKSGRHCPLDALPRAALADKPSPDKSA